MSSRQVKSDLEALFIDLGLATEENNRGLGMVPAPHDRWCAKLMGHVIAYDKRDVDFTSVETKVSESRTFFSAGEKEGELRINNFSTNDFQLLVDWWHARLIPGARPVDSLADIAEAYALIAQLLDDQLSRLGKVQSVDNRIYLLNLTMARKQSRLPLFPKAQFTPEVPELALPLLEWWNAGVGVEYALHFFNPYAGGGFIKSGNNLFSKTIINDENRPAISMEDALDLSGIPLASLRALYPNGGERF